MTESIQKVFDNFAVTGGRVTKVEQCYNGHISRTFFVSVDEGNEERKYVMQEVNEYVFSDMKTLMENIFAVTGFLYRKAVENGEDPSRSVLRFYKTKTGELYCRAADGKPWRIYDYIDGASTYNSCPGPEFFTEVGRSFGNFTKKLAGFDATKLGEVIPNFHNTASRYQKFLEAVEKNAAGRKDGVKDEIKFVTDRKDICEMIVKTLENKEIPLRVTHNDTKLNNILIDDETKKGICIIDLDTIMPGSVLYDFGDAIRFGASTAAEDETDLDKVTVNMEMFSAFSKGYVGELKGFITDQEIRLLPLGALVITLETGIRFLTDYLDGDKYFHVARENHNLDRARNQFKLVSEMEKRMDEMNKIINGYMNLE